jgi:glycosyltransferase involved in cell wall biosynthesis
MGQRHDFSQEQWSDSHEVQLTRQGRGLLIANRSGALRSLELRFPVRIPGAPPTQLQLRIAGETLEGSGFGVVARLGDTTHYPMPLNSWNRFEVSGPLRLSLRIDIGPRCTVRLDEFWAELGARESHLFDEHLAFDSTLLITPTYPSSNHLYLAGFVHSRVRAYHRAGLRPVVLCAFNAYGYQSVYEHEGVRVLRGGYSDLLAVLNKHRFHKLLVHFFDEHYAVALDRALNNREAEVVLWCHGPETLFWDLPAVNGPYFSKAQPPNEATTRRYRLLEQVMKNWAARRNVSWVFVSEWQKRRSEELLGLRFERAHCIPNPVDTSVFHFHPKSAAQRRRVMLLRRYDDEKKYAVDLAAQALVELARRPVFSSLEFHVHGEGPMLEALFAPLKGHDNIHFHRRFADHAQIARIHEQCGIALFPTRYDAQGVSACEAAASGLVVVSTDSSAVPEFLPPAHGALAPPEDPVALADLIERFATDERAFDKAARGLSAHVTRLCRDEATTQRELALIREPVHTQRAAKPSRSRRKLLTVVVPTYSMQQLLPRCLSSMLQAEDLAPLEVLVVDDGSKDRSLEVARAFEARFPGVVRVIAKENGGHGSTINRGLAEAQGRYFRVVDSDDWVDPVNFERFLARLAEEDADCVITPYAEDWAHREDLLEKDIYANLVPDRLYTFEVLASREYGFRSWGPVLASATFQTKLLRKAGLRLDERIAYVDMEYAALALTYVDSVRLYDLSVYRYFLGRPNQSVERASYERRYPQHEQVIFRVAAYVDGTSELSAAKRRYVQWNLLKPMVDAHRMILSEWIDDEQELEVFDRALKRFPCLRELPVQPVATRDSLRARVRRAVMTTAKRVLPYRFVEGLGPNLLSDGRRAVKYAAEYFAPHGAMTLVRDARAGRFYWYSDVASATHRLANAPRRLLAAVTDLR